MSTSEHDIEQRQKRLEALAAQGDLAAVREEAGQLHPSDLADLVELLDEAQQIELLSALPTELASDTLAEMEEGEERGDLLAALAPEKGAELLHELPDDDAVDLIGELEPDEQSKILAALPVDEAGELKGLLEYDEETAGGLMTTDLVEVQATLTAAQAIDQVRVQGQEVEDFYTVFVVDGDRSLLGTLRLDDLIIANPGESIEALVEAPIATVRPDLDQELVGKLIARYNLASIPVVDEEGALLGRITFDDVIDVIEAEQTEDIFRLAGVTDEDALKHTWTESVRTRLPWLMLNLITASLAASVIIVFEETINAVIALAFLAPIIAAMGGSSGTQSLAVTIRRITTHGSGSARGFVAKEILIGLVNGAVLGGGIALVAFLRAGDPVLGLVVFLAMWGNQIVAGFAGAFIPTSLDRMGIDPSVASSVFVHTLTDLCGFFLLLCLASKLLM
ncbi:MAG: magnesium transporter [Gemmatimonadota bacterium]|nr:magnesium transporter [Gemmatimonadota bacterium]